MSSYKRAASCECCPKDLGVLLAERATGITKGATAKDSRRRQKRLLRVAAVATGHETTSRNSSGILLSTESDGEPLKQMRVTGGDAISNIEPGTFPPSISDTVPATRGETEFFSQPPVASIKKERASSREAPSSCSSDSEWFFHSDSEFEAESILPVSPARRALPTPTGPSGNCPDHEDGDKPRPQDDGMGDDAAWPPHDEAAASGRSGGLAARPLLNGEDLPASLTRATVSGQALWQATGGCVVPPHCLNADERRARERRLKAFASDGTIKLPRKGGRRAAEDGNDAPNRDEESSEDEDDASSSGGEEGDLLLEVTNQWGSSVSKSFVCQQCGHVTTAAVRIPRFRVLGAQQPSAGQTLKSTSHLLPPGVPCGGESPAVRPRRGEKHAEFLVVVELGAYTFGVWRRFSEFKELSEQIIGSGSDSEGGGGGGGGSEWGHFPNAAFSWQCIRMRKRWYRCLDQDYLAVKCFLLERFIHDVISEAPDPAILCAFIGA